MEEERIKELYDRTIAWAEKHNITNIHTQALKTYEEWSETISELNHNRFGEDFEDGIGDTVISFLIFCHIADKDLVKCWEDSLNVIEKRSGISQNGNFIKNEALEKQ